MGLSDFLASRLSRPASRVLDAPIRDLVQEVLRESGYASPAEVEQLRDQARDLRGRLDGIDKRLGELVRMVESARAEAAAAAQKAAAVPAPAPGPDPRVAELEARLTALAGELEGARAAAVAVPAPAPAAPPLTAAPRGGCKVPGCAESVRSKGFCSAHYQQWRRGTLKEFVNMDGTAMVEGRAVSVSPDLAGGHVTVQGGRVLVDGQDVGAA